MRTALAIAMLWPTWSHATEYEVSATTIQQLDQLRRVDSAAGGAVAGTVDRRRLTQELRLRIFQILPSPSEPGDVVPRLQVVTSLRFDRDFGDYRDTEDANGIDVVPELENDELDLLLLFAEGRDFASGTVDFRVGRQTMADLLGLYAFDGADVVFHPPVYLALEGFGGFHVRTTTSLGSPTMELDGTSTSPYWEDERDALSPMFGGALSTHGLPFLHARASYRRTYSRASVATTCTSGPCADGVDRLTLDGIDEEKFALSTRGLIAGILHPYAGARYNVVTVRVDVAEAGVRWALHPRHAITPAWSRRVPEFDADSIFNLYELHPYQDGSLAYDVKIRKDLRGHARLLVRRFTNGEVDTEGGDLPVDTSDYYAGFVAGAHWERRRGHVRLDARYEDGYGGLLAGADVAGSWRMIAERLTLEGRTSLLRFESDLRAPELSRATWGLGLQASARWRLYSWSAVKLLIEENRSEVYPSYLRAVLLLDLHTPGAR